MHSSSFSKGTERNERGRPWRKAEWHTQGLSISPHSEQPQVGKCKTWVSSTQGELYGDVKPKWEGVESFPSEIK